MTQGNNSVTYNNCTYGAGGSVNGSVSVSSGQLDIDLEIVSAAGGSTVTLDIDGSLSMSTTAVVGTLERIEGAQTSV